MKARMWLAWLVLVAVPVVAQQQDPAANAWPAITGSSKPWTRWWWPGSAVDKANLTKQLEAIAAAGIGGVEITPIYGAKGAEDRYVKFISPQWMDMLDHTTREAARLGLGVDMATGTGWPFGGPEVSAADGSSSLAWVDGKLVGKLTEMKVKRAAPGGEGLVLDPYSTAALDRYLQPFSRAFAAFPRARVRMQFHDSFEYYNSSWTASLPAVFRQMHGYDLQTYGAQIAGQQPLDDDTLARVKGDYRRTLARLHLDYVNAWVRWSHEHGFKARNQAHGAPGNLLDLYGAADVPETESFGLTQLPIVGLRGDPVGVSVDPDPPEVTIGRFASSAAHVMGKPLVSSETLTWLRENYRESPAAAKPQLDRLFAAGINHIFYHGTVYSPADAEWPGWFFYASTQLTPSNPLWDDFGAMHAYVARVQSVLQAGKPDNDILLYWPFDEVVEHSSGLMEQYGVHDNQWLTDSATGRLSAKLLRAGFAYDLVSDAQLQRVKARGGEVIAPGGRYRVIVVPAARRMSVETLERLVVLARQGARVLFEASPQDVPGLGRLEARRAKFAALLADPALRKATLGENLETVLATIARREPAAPAGLSYIRRAQRAGHDYFFANLGTAAFDGWLELGVSAESATLLDPLTGRVGAAAVKRDVDGRTRVYLQLASGESIVLRTSTAKSPAPAAQRWAYAKPVDAGVVLAGPWDIEFLKGGPVLPKPARFEALSSWTTLADDEVQRFAGTARYRLEFDAPAKSADAWELDLGDVREVARVTLNGERLTTAWSLPFRVHLGALKARGNVLEIEVTNLPANRIRDLDMRKVPWKTMRDINLVSVKYKPFDAAAWDVEPAGLLGPVTLVPLAVVSP